MSTQKQNDGNANRGQQDLTAQRGQQDERQTSPPRRSAGQRQAGRMRQNPISLMRRMFDDLDVNSLASGFGAPASNPFAMMRRMFNTMERMLESSELSDDLDQGMTALDFVPRIDVRRREDQLVIRADLPGIPRDQIRIYAQDDALVIEGERSETRDASSEDIWRAERVYGYFRRMVPLPEGAQIDDAEARFADGVLEIAMPFSGEGRRRRIEIQGAEQGAQTPRSERH